MSRAKTTWEKTSEGYRGTGLLEGATLYKQGKGWVLEFGGQIHAMPKRASFDHAEGLMATLLD